MKEALDMQDVVNLCKSRGFIFQGSEIYGGLANSWDYGPLGIELKNNIKNCWWKSFVQRNPHNVGLDAAILMNPRTWEASGHLSGFSDPLMDCKACKTRHRADKLIEEWFHEHGESEVADGWPNEKMESFIQEKGIICPDCGKSDFTEIRQFNLMYKTYQGVTEDKKAELYLRPETAQGIFVNFKNVLLSTRHKMPMGIAQIGKSFRNEITPGNFIFRVREFEQMELEFFCEPSTDLEWFAHWKTFIREWLVALGLDDSRLRFRDHCKEELSFYSKCTTDIEFNFPFGWGELYGIADRTDYDLKQHMEFSGKDLNYFDPETNEKYVPYCIEPSVSIERLFLAILCSAYTKETLEDNSERTVLKLTPAMAPIKACIMPLSKKLKDKALEVYQDLAQDYMIEYDEAGSIGRRYRRQDEIGTPYCITVDFDTLEDNQVTIRDRDTMEQQRIAITDLKDFLKEKLAY